MPSTSRCVVRGEGSDPHRTLSPSNEGFTCSNLRSSTAMGRPTFLTVVTKYVWFAGVPAAVLPMHAVTVLHETVTRCRVRQTLQPESARASSPVRLIPTHCMGASVPHHRSTHAAGVLGVVTALGGIAVGTNGQ